MNTSNDSYLLEYRAKGKTKEILIGEDLMCELDNLAEDMISGEYTYDRSDALLRIDFIENCVRLTKSPFYGKPFKLLLWQKAFIEAVYSFKTQSTEGTLVDRFQEILLLISRKNGKSETIAALQLAELIIGGKGLDIVCSGQDDGTADLAYQAIDTMRLLIDPKSVDTWRNQKGIKCLANNNHIYKLSDSTRQKEGRNIDIAGIDEVWSLQDGGIYKTIQQSTSTKEKFKIFLFGSEGFVDGFLDKKREEFTKIAHGEDFTESSKRKLPWLYTQDTETEVWNTDINGMSRAWEKSNPSIGTVKKYDYLRDRVDEARQSKADRIFVLAKDFNIKQNAAEAWLNIEDYSYVSSFQISEFRGVYCIGAVDLAETTDLCAAKVLMMKPNDPRKYIFSHYFIPETKITENDDSAAGAKYKEWAEQGLITVSEGNDIDLSIVADWFYSLYTDYGIRVWKVGYDQKFAKDWISKMEGYGWSRSGGDQADLVMILQNAQTLSNAIKLAEADFKKHLIYYNDNPVDRWNFGNAGIEIKDATGQALIVKMQFQKKIDGAVCLAIAYETYRRYRSEFKILVEKLGG
jgi:phage terminase large subunit-like protein